MIAKMPMQAHVDALGQQLASSAALLMKTNFTAAEMSLLPTDLANSPGVLLAAGEDAAEAADAGAAAHWRSTQARRPANSRGGRRHAGLGLS
jgi:hypothetical protein